MSCVKIVFKGWKINLRKGSKVWRKFVLLAKKLSSKCLRLGNDHSHYQFCFCLEIWECLSEWSLLRVLHEVVVQILGLVQTHKGLPRILFPAFPPHVTVDRKPVSCHKNFFIHLSQQLHDDRTIEEEARKTLLHRLKSPTDQFSNTVVLCLHSSVFTCTGQ